MTIDTPTFEQIVDMHYQPLYRFAFTLARQEASAWDLTQETFRKFAAKGHQLIEPKKVKTWLFTTLYREFIDGHRRNSRLESLDSSTASGIELESFSPEQADKVDAASARQALLQLDDTFRAPLVLFYLEDHSYQEIAEILEVPLGTVMSRISRGRTMLRERLLADKIPTNRAARDVIALEKV
jgi:RNA polymerase sigma-70 factor, ECF subfamily